MHIGLFGGSFNPPHLAHLIIAETIREQYGLEHIWWIPAYRPPHKAGAALASSRHRLAMTRQAIAGHPAFDVLDIEIRREGTSYTVDTVRALQEAHPAHRFSLLIGGDSLREFGTWYKPDEILARVEGLIVYQRPGTEQAVLERWLEDHVCFAEAPLLEISSTAIRKRLHMQQSIRYLVPEAVRTYITKHRLYEANGTGGC